MVFSSLFFTFAFLPVTTLLYYLVGKRFRDFVLLVASLFFYAWGEPIYVLLMCGSIVINYWVGNLLGKSNFSKQQRKLFLIGSLVFNLGCLAYFKYFGMIVDTIAAIGGWSFNVVIPELPIGISFYTFQLLSYLIDVYWGKSKPQRSLLHFALYISMFPQLVAGPIVNYADIKSQLSDRSLTYAKFTSGLRSFLSGLAKKLLLADNIGLVWTNIKTISDSEVSVVMAWAGILAFALQIYFDFSGYSDMAIGLGKMFGFRFKENFRYPYLSQSVSEFWRRWHISLGSWFRQYVYIPLGGNRVSKCRLAINLSAVWFLTGIWHGASWNFVAWGLYFGALILLENLFLREHIARWPKVVRHGYSLVMVVVGWVFFEFQSIPEIINYLKLMFGLGGNVLAGHLVWAQLRKYGFLFIVCIIAATSGPKNLALMVRKNHRKVYTVLANVYYVLLVFVATAYLVGSTHNPFIYFRF